MLEESLCLRRRSAEAGDILYVFCYWLKGKILQIQADAIPTNLHIRPLYHFKYCNFPQVQPANKASEEWFRKWKCSYLTECLKYIHCILHTCCENILYTVEPLNHQEVILSCFPSLLVPYLFLSSQVHVLIIHIATGTCIRVSTVKFKKRVPGSLPRMHAHNDFS